MNEPGVIRIGGYPRRARMRPSEVLAHMARPLRKVAVVELEEIRLDAGAHAAGFEDGKAGRGWNGDAHRDLDLVAYCRGYTDGARVRRESL